MNELFRRNAVFAHQVMGDWDHLGRRDVEAISGAFMMVRSEIARAVGGLPEELFRYHEDLAFALRVRRAGWKICYLGDVETLHHGEASRRKSSSPLSLLEGEVRVRLIRERGGPVRAALARPMFGLRSLNRLVIALVGRVLPEPANYSVTRCYACGYPVADTLWITSDIQNERAAAAGVVPFIFCDRDRFLRLLALGVSEAIVNRTLQLVGSLYL